MTKINKYLAAVLSGAMLALAFPPLPFFILAFTAFVPLLMIFAEDNIKKPYLLLYITFFIYHTGSNWWIGSWQADSDPYLTASSIVLDFVHPFFFMIPFGLFFIIKKRLSYNSALWLFPFFWVAFEWAHNLGELSYPWLTIGNNQIYNHYWVQFIDITGVWGSSLLICFINVILVKLITAYNLSGNFNNFIKNRNNIIYISSFLLLIIVPVIYGGFRISEYEHKYLLKNNPKISVGLIQPAINPWRKWVMSVDEMVQLQINISDSLLNTKKKAQLIIWNETAVPSRINIKQQYSYINLLAWSQSKNVSLFTGIAELRLYDSLNKTVTARQDIEDKTLYYETYNSSLLINPGEFSRPQVYAKMRLTPMAERLPYSEYLMFMRSWFEWGVGISAWGIGTAQKNLEVKTKDGSASLGPIICIESIYPEFVANTSKNGAEFLVVITNDAWYDYTPGPEQHYLISAIRAIENRRYIARCANTGITGVLSATGETVSRLPQYVKAGLYEEIPRLKDVTFYAKHGDWLAVSAALISLISIIFAIFKLKFNF